MDEFSLTTLLIYPVTPVKAKAFTGMSFIKYHILIGTLVPKIKFL